MKYSLDLLFYGWNLLKRNNESKTLSKYTATFDYFSKILLLLSATRGGVSIASFATVIGVPVRLANASLSLLFSISNVNSKKLFKTMRKNKKETQKSCFLVN